MDHQCVIDYETPRHSKGLSRNDVVMLLADKGVDISSESLGCYERGVRDPSPDMVMELSEIYGQPLSGRESYLEGFIVAATKETPPDKAVIGGFNK